MSLRCEAEICELEKQIEALKLAGASQEDIDALQERSQIMIARIYQNITPWERVLVARHNNRPKLNDYLKIFDNLVTLRGDKRFNDDNAIYTGIGLFKTKKVAIIGHNKGNKIEDKIKNNFGMANPSGYYKAMRLMKFAERFLLPIISFIDTPGAAAGIESEEQGQFHTIAECISLSLALSTPSIAIITGEGGSGGAIALATTDRVLMLENSIYSVISPEGCSSILWKSADHKEQAAESLKINAEELLKMNMIDRVIKEPIGGAHRNIKQTINNVEEILWEELNELKLTDKKRFQ